MAAGAGIGGTVGAGIEEQPADVEPADAVHHRMVDLGDQREPVVGQAVDHVELPQRPAAVELAGLDPGDQLAQLGVAARLRQGAVPHVVAEVEVGVVDPDLVGETAGHPAQLLPVARCRADPVADLLCQPRVVPDAAGGDGEGGHRADVHRRG